MDYNFDEEIDRRGTETIKYERAKMLFGTDDLMALWVADMDFRTGPFIFDAIKKRSDQGVLGYTMPSVQYTESIVQWQASHHQWQVEPHWVKHVPGVLPAISLAVLSLTQEGDQIMVQPPIYPPFMSIANANGRRVLYNELIQKGDRYEIDFEDFEKKAEKAKLFFLCSPHNPGGRIWSIKELQKMAEICAKHKVIVISDEIHADLSLPGYKHTPFSTVSKDAANSCITLMAPSKTFNIAGLSSAFCIVSNGDLRRKLFGFIDDAHAGYGSLFGYDATIAAFTEGEMWRQQMINYLQGNIDYVMDFLRTNVPSIVAMKPHASFLLWLDCKALNMSDEELKKFMVHQVGVGMNQGPSFGPGGSGFQRLNVGTPRKNLEYVMHNLAEKVNALNESSFE